MDVLITQLLIASTRLPPATSAAGQATLRQCADSPTKPATIRLVGVQLGDHFVVLKLPNNYVASDNSMNTSHSDGGDQEDSLGLFTIRGHETPGPIMVDLKVNGKIVPIKVDTGATVTIVSQATWKTLFPQLPLQVSTVH